MLPSYALLERQSDCQTTRSSLLDDQSALMRALGPNSLPSVESLNDENPRTISQSLRGQVKKWLAPAMNTPVKLTRHNNQNLQCVRAEVKSATHSLIIFFFKHPDGAWQVFPPCPARPAMRTCAMQAQCLFADD
jgi:hypothetical protein